MLSPFRSYLDRENLCGRVRVQSFIEADLDDIERICSRAGWRVKGAAGRQGNLCISQSPMSVFDVSSKKLSEKCVVTNIRPREHPVVVACDGVGDRCLPVHYERYKEQEMDNHKLCTESKLSKAE